MSDAPIDADEGGEGACFAHLICPDCGAVLDGADHLQWCTWLDPSGALDSMDIAGPSRDVVD